jgi:uncharacterized protein YlxW (UPF0749 family)
VTTAHRAGGVRALGASLLDQVLAETVDPAYRQAAEARAAQETTATGPAAPVRRERRSAGLVALTMLLTGLLLAVAYHQAAAGSQGREQIRAALVADIQRESAAGDRLAAELEEVEKEVSATRDHLLESSAEGQRALERLTAARTGAAAVPLAGPGLLITLADAAPGADEDPVGGTVTDDPREKVSDGDLQLAVNALWAAGAEAISVNDRRLGPTTAIRFAGEAVLVDFRPVTSPYEIRAVGDPGQMSRGFLESPDVRALALISETYGLRFDYAQEDELTLPAATPAELRLAEPVDDTAAAELPASSGPAAPGTATGTAATPSAPGTAEPEAVP